MSQIRLKEEKQTAVVAGEAERGKPILRVSNLVVTFQKQMGFLQQKQRINAVNNVSFDIFKSEFVSVVGESGSGKTTLARCLLGLQRPQFGSIFYNGIDITKLRGKGMHKYLQDVQIVYQDPFESLNPRQNIFNIISTPIRSLTGEKDGEILRSRVSSLLEEVELDPNQVMYRYPHQLSGGQRQRVNIARALAPNPKLLVADEPITMLDAAQRLNILSLLLDLKDKRGLTVLMITHELSSARVTSNRIMIMYYGKVVESGEAELVLSKPHHPYVELIMQVTPSIKDLEQQHSTPSSQSAIISPQATITKNTSAGQDLAINAANYQGCIFRTRCKYATKVCTDVDPKFEEKSVEHYVACHNPLNMGGR